ncbi:MAG: hypothetical protein AAB909_04555, partial [Patescibacteria group bacterium]
SLGLILFLRHQKIHNSSFILLSSLFMGLTLWSYQAAKFMTPVILLALFFIAKSKKQLVVPWVLFLLVASPIVVGLSTQSGRLNTLSVFNYTRSKESVENILDQGNDSLISYLLFHSESLDQFRGVIERYLNHFSPRYLFFEGDWSNIRHTTAYYGYFHPVEVITILLGLYWVIKRPSRGSFLLFFWLVTSPIASSLSRDVVSGVRSFPMVIPLTLLSAVGLSKLLQSKILFFLFISALGFFTIYYLDLYYVHTPHYAASAWLYPYKRAIQLVNNNIDSFDKVIFTNTLGQPYIFVLFYNQVDPRLYQPWANISQSATGDVGEVASWGKYVFKKVDWPAERGYTSTIFVGDQYELPEQDLNPANLVRLGEIEYPNGLHGLRIVGLK